MNEKNSGCGLPRLLRSLAMTNGARGGIHKLVIARVAFATRGNLSMGYNYSFMGFFLFSVFVFIISGL